MSIYSDKLSHVQVVINCRNTDAQMCTCEDVLAYISGVPSIDDVMSYNSLTTIQNRVCLKINKKILTMFLRLFWRSETPPVKRIKKIMKQHNIKMFCSEENTKT